jgi:D-3-phosphoglycerate dehydrogenase
MKWRVLISCPHLQKTIDKYRGIFKENNIDIHLPSVTQALSESDLMEIIDNYDGIIAGDDEITAKVLEKAKKLKVISKWGVGIDAIDVKTAEKLGVRVFNTPNVFGDEVADVVIGYILLLARKIHIIDKRVREGNWNSAQIQGISLRNKTLGVIGVGSIGRGVVERGGASGMNILGYDVFPIDHSFIEKHDMRVVDLDELIKESDFISLNCNLTESNYHIISEAEFEKMKNSAYLINTSRGPLIDEEALINALSTGKIAGAALDVFESEPLQMDSPLRSFENCILGAHNSSNTIDAVLRVNDLAIENLLKGLGG